MTATIVLFIFVAIFQIATIFICAYLADSSECVMCPYLLNGYAVGLFPPKCDECALATKYIIVQTFDEAFIVLREQRGLGWQNVDTEQLDDGSLKLKFKRSTSKTK